MYPRSFVTVLQADRVRVVREGGIYFRVANAVYVVLILRFSAFAAGLIEASLWSLYVHGLVRAASVFILFYILVARERLSEQMEGIGEADRGGYLAEGIAEADGGGYPAEGIGEADRGGYLAEGIAEADRGGIDEGIAGFEVEGNSDRIATDEAIDGFEVEGNSDRGATGVDIVEFEEPVFEELKISSIVTIKNEHLVPMAFNVSNLPLQEPEITLLQQYGVELRCQECLFDSDKGDGRATLGPWSLTHEQQVHNLKENLERTLCWAGVLFKFEQHLELNALLARIVSELKNNLALDSYQIQLEKENLQHLAVKSKMTTLDLAILMGDLKMVQKILERGSSIPVNVIRGHDTNLKENIYYTPLYLAVVGGDSHIMDVLLKKGADVNAPNSSCQTPFDLAYKKGDVTILQQLLRNDKEQKKPLHIAVRFQDINFIQSSPSQNVHVINYHKETPLHLAVKAKESQIVEALLEKGADINAPNWLNRTPLDLACKNRDVTILQQLLKNDREQRDLLHIAVRLGDINFIQRLPSQNVNAVDYKNMTPLHYLAMQNFLSSHDINYIVKYFDHDKALDVKALDSNGLSAFYLAIIYRNTKFVIALLDSFKDQIRLNAACNKDLGPPIQIAMEGGDDFKHIERALMECNSVKGYMDNLYRDRQVFVDAANAILVGAALIASVTFASWLQRPLNYTSYVGEGYSSSVSATSTSDLNYVDVEHNIALRAFWVFNALSFYFAIETVVCGAQSVLPRRHLFIKKIVDRLHTNLLVTSTLLACSMLFVIIAFAIARTIVLTPLVKYQWCMIVPTIVGGMVCIISLGFLVKNMVENCFKTYDSNDRLNKIKIEYLSNKGDPNGQCDGATSSRPPSI